MNFGWGPLNVLKDLLTAVHMSASGGTLVVAMPRLPRETREMQSLYYEGYSRIKGERKAPSFVNCFESPSLLLSCAFNPLTTVRGSVSRRPTLHLGLVSQCF